MADRKGKAEADPINWLLEVENPSVRYSTLTAILDKPETDQDVIAAKQDIMQPGIVPEILTKQRDSAYEDGVRRFYHTKYWGLVCSSSCWRNWAHRRMSRSSHSVNTF